MLLNDLTLDPSKLASGLNIIHMGFEYVGGWNTFGPAMLAGAICAAVGIKWWPALGYYYHNNFFTRLRESRRMQRAEEKRLQELAADLITDAFEKHHFDRPSELNLEQKQYLFKLIGKRCGFDDLLARGADTTPIKEQIKERLAKEERDAVGKVKPVKFPDSTGTQVVGHRKTSHVHVF